MADKKTRDYVRKLNGALEDKLPFAMADISAHAQHARHWQIIASGEHEHDVQRITFVNKELGVSFEYGMRPEGYDGVVIHEPNGGGSITIPYMIHPETGAVYVGLIKEHRALLGGDVWNVPRGYVTMGETHLQAAEREVIEEMGYDAEASGHSVIKLADGLNPNSAYFDTSGTTAEGAPEGVAIFAIVVHHDQLELVTQEGQEDVYVFPKHLRTQVHADHEEKIYGSMFVPIKAAVMSRDLFTSAAAGQLLVHLMK